MRFQNAKHTRRIISERDTDGEYPVSVVVTEEVNILGIWLDGPDGEVLVGHVQLSRPQNGATFREISTAVRQSDVYTPPDACIKSVFKAYRTSNEEV